jgi:hypothetical protein
MEIADGVQPTKMRMRLKKTYTNNFDFIFPPYNLNDYPTDFGYQVLQEFITMAVSEIL